MDYVDSTLKEYLDDLAGRKHVPGGGSAAALVASAASALNLMVINYTLKPGAGGDIAESFSSLREKQEDIRASLMRLVDEDCKAFSSLMDTLSSGKENQEKYMISAGVPLEVCRKSADSLMISLDMLPDSNRNLLSDIGCAAHMFKAAFFSARLNVEINLKYIKDPSYVSRTKTELDSIARRVEKISSSILERIG